MWRSKLIQLGQLDLQIFVYPPQKHSTGLGLEVLTLILKIPIGIWNSLSSSKDIRAALCWGKSESESDIASW